MSSNMATSMPNLPPLVEGKVYKETEKRDPGKAAQMARMKRRTATEGPRRQAFVNGLLNEDLTQLTKWHGSRPPHEQKRFLRSVDTLYKSFTDQGDPFALKRDQQREAKSQAEAMERQMKARAEAGARAAEEDPMNGPPRSPRAQQQQMGSSASAPTMPIDVFEARKRDAMNGGPDLTSIDRWMEGGSVSTATTGTSASTRFTTLSQKTKTSSGGPSICSEPGTMHQLEYRNHKRGMALNRSQWAAPDQHGAGNLKHGVPNFGLPDGERMQTTFQDQFGKRPLAENITPQMYQSVFREGAHKFLDNFVETAQPEKRDQFAGMVRSLEYLRMANTRQNTTIMRTDMDLHENKRLWNPAEATPWFDKSNSNMSQIPLGTLPQSEPDPVRAALVESQRPKPPPPQRMCPPSPSVSNLGSVPLSRMSTPGML